MRWAAIINPKAGSRLGRKARLIRVREFLSSSVEVVQETKGRGDVATFVRQARDFDGIVIAGGDGTVGEALNALRAGQSLAIIPCGRGNSLANDLGLRTIQQTSRLLKKPVFHNVDLMRFTLTTATGQVKGLAASTIAVGYPVQVTSLASTKLRHFGRQSYAVAAGIRSAGCRKLALSLSFDNHSPTRKSLRGLLINNTRHIANFVGFPNSQCNDGQLAVMEMNLGFVGQNLHNLSALLAKSAWLPKPPVAAKSFSAQLDHAQDVMIDGEIHPDVIRIDVELEGGQLRCVGDFS